jgi:hypothetical protein
MSGNVADPRLFDHDPFSGHTEYFHYDPETDGFSIETQQDVEYIIETNKALSNDAPTRFGELTRVASIPSVVVMQLAAQGILSSAGAILDADRFRLWLNDRDNRAFRTRTGKV